MTRRTILLATLALTTVLTGAAYAAHDSDFRAFYRPHHQGRHSEHARSDDHHRLTGDHARPARPTPTDANAAETKVPANGLFRPGARPTVEVQ